MQRDRNPEVIAFYAVSSKNSLFHTFRIVKSGNRYDAVQNFFSIFIGKFSNTLTKYLYSNATPPDRWNSYTRHSFMPESWNEIAKMNVTFDIFYKRMRIISVFNTGYQENSIRIRQLVYSYWSFISWRYIHWDICPWSIFNRDKVKWVQVSRWN